MGGRIWVDSDSGQGASFVFELPVARGRPREGVTVGRQDPRV